MNTFGIIVPYRNLYTVEKSSPFPQSIEMKIIIKTKELCQIPVCLYIIHTRVKTEEISTNKGCGWISIKNNA